MLSLNLQRGAKSQGAIFYAVGGPGGSGLAVSGDQAGQFTYRKAPMTAGVTICGTYDGAAFDTSRPVP